MEEALLVLLQRLEVIEQSHDGLGDTNVRDHMGADIFRGFLRPQSGFLPSGEYGMEPEANRLIAEALVEYCCAANEAAGRAGLTTFQERVAAFQNSNVRTASGADYNDYFGYLVAADCDAAGNALPAEPRSQTQCSTKAWHFNWPGSQADLLLQLNRTGPWQWKEVGQDYEPYLEFQSADGLRVQIREGFEEMGADGTVTPPQYAYFTKLEMKGDCLLRGDELVGVYETILKQLPATDVSDADAYYW
jgi:hypothetical protein